MSHDKFARAITQYISSFGIAGEDKRFYGKTIGGEEFCFVQTSWAWYALRFFYESEVKDGVAQPHEPKTDYIFLNDLLNRVSNDKTKILTNYPNQAAFDMQIDNALQKLNGLNIIEKVSDCTNSGSYYALCKCQSISKCTYGLLLVAEKGPGGNTFGEFRYCDDSEFSRFNKIRNYLSTASSTDVLCNVNRIITACQLEKPELDWSAVEIPKENYKDLDTVLQVNQIIGVTENASETKLKGVYLGKNKVMLMKLIRSSDPGHFEERIVDVENGFNDSTSKLYWYQGDIFA